MTPLGAYWHLSLPPPSLLFQNATTSIHFQSALSNGNNWFLPLLRKWNKLVIKHFFSKSKFRDPHQHFGGKTKKANSLKQKQEVAKDVWGEKDKGGVEGWEWNNEWRASELSFPGRAPLGMQTLSHQKWATYLWKEWLLHPIWFGSPIIS